MPPETKTQRYRRRADELRDMARAAKDSGVQNEMLVLAQQYDKLADDVSHRDK